MAQYPQEDVQVEGLNNSELADVVAEILDHLKLKVVVENQYGRLYHKVVNEDHINNLED